MVRGAFWSILVPFLNLVVNIFCSLDIQIGSTSPEKAMAGVLINAGVSGTSWILSIWDSRSIVASDFMVLCFLEFSFLTKFHARTMKKKISFLLYVLTSEILICQHVWSLLLHFYCLYCQGLYLLKTSYGLKNSCIAREWELYPSCNIF